MMKSLQNASPADRYPPRTATPPNLATRRRQAALRSLTVGCLLAIASAVCCGQTIQPNGPQQLTFARLLASSNPSQTQAQINALRIDAQGNLYLLLDQKDGVRLLKTDPSASNILAQAQIGVAGDIGLAMALAPPATSTSPGPPLPAH